MTFSGQSDLILVATKSTDSAGAAAWVDATAARAERCGAQLWAMADTPPAGRPGAGHSHVLSFTADAWIAWEREVALERSGDHLDTHAEVARDHWRTQGIEIRLDDAEATSLIVAEVVCTDPSAQAEWDDWYTEQHLPDMMASMAFVAGHRWTRNELRPGGPNHLTVYEIAGRAVDAAIAESAAIMPALIADGRKHRCHTGGRTLALNRVS